MTCPKKKYDELTAKNEALRLTRKTRFRQPKTGPLLGQARAYYCKECNAWHVREETPTQVGLQPLRVQHNVRQNYEYTSTA